MRLRGVDVHDADGAVCIGMALCHQVEVFLLDILEGSAVVAICRDACRIVLVLFRCILELHYERVVRIDGLLLF